MKETIKEGRRYALFCKALLSFAAAFVMLCINPLIAHAADLPMGSEDDGYYIDSEGNLTIYSQEGLENWAYDIMGGPDTYKAMVKTLTVNEGVTSIEIQDIYQYGISSDKAFYGCRNLTSVSLPASLEVIGYRAFGECESLTTVTIVEPSSLTTIGESAFGWNRALTAITIPASVTSIGAKAFEGAGLTSVTIPASVTSIGSEAFVFCTELNLVTMLGETPPTLGDGDGNDSVFESTGITAAYVDTKDKQIYVPKSSIQAYKESWTRWKDYINDGEGGGSETPDPDPGTDTPDPDPDPGTDTPQAGGSVEGVDPAAEDYADVPIDVKAHTVSNVVYSVDVEWGAMTFQYVSGTWDTENHKYATDAGWKVYDSAGDTALDTKEDAINRIQVTNHSNAGVKATLAYAGRTGYEDTAGSFAKAASDADTVYDETNKTLTLATAANSEGGAAGSATVGTVYFMPDGIKETYKADGITKWTQLGTITVSILTEESSK